MKLTVAVVSLTLLTAVFAARHARPARPQATSYEAIAERVHVEVGATSTTVTIRTPRGLDEALDWR